MDPSSQPMNGVPEPPPPSSPADDLARRLQQELARRRPRPWLPILATLVASILILALLTWWLYPRPQPEVFQVMALDAVFTPEETPRARAQLLMPEEEESPRSLRGHTVVFHEQQLFVKPGEKPREVVATSDEHGQATVEWPVANSPADFLTLYVNARRKQGSARDQGWVYVWPKDASVLLVDVDETLYAEQLDEQAQAALQQAATDGWHIAYLALASAQAQEFRVVRGWMEQQATLPKGPVLGRRYYPDETVADQARRDEMQSFKNRFHSKIVSVVRSDASAQLGQELKVRIIRLGEQAKTWEDVPALLK